MERTGDRSQEKRNGFLLPTPVRGEPPKGQAMVQARGQVAQGLGKSCDLYRVRVDCEEAQRAEKEGYNLLKGKG